jgi:hypothetical protein
VSAGSLSLRIMLMITVHLQFQKTLLTLLEETRKHSGIIFSCFQSDNFHLSVTHEMETMHSAWLPEKEYQATKMYNITTGHSASRQ